MNQTEMLFRKDVADKGRTARGAYSKKTHNGKGGCHLPHEDLTEAQRAKLNGDIVTYNLNKPMLWAEFKALPQDLQAEYLRGLQDKYNVRDNLLSEMFGVSAHTVFKVRNALGVMARESRVSTADRERFRLFCASDPAIPAAQKARKAAYDRETEILGLTVNDAKEREAPPTTVVADPEGPRISTSGIPTATWEDLFLAAKLVGQRYGVKVQVVVG